ncbi:bacteriophage holin [Actinophytocola sediminis]
MSYLPAIVVAAVGLALLGALVVRMLRHVRRFETSAAVVNARLNDGAGHLKARSAALRVAINETRARVKQTSVDVPSVHRGRQEEDRG